ncbi:DnaJ domain-containing protein [Entophlyctis helioformis]|nr:DnaJ domain-containing protein [Entophlyctis helioformis]
MAAVAAPGAMDFYKILGIDRATEEDGIKRAYRKMALKLHPERNPSPEAREQFVRVAEAYHVLSDAKRKAIYDQYGLGGLRKGVPAKHDFDGYEGGYEFHNNADEIFNQFFGGKNPFSDFFSMHAEPEVAIFGSKFGGLHGMNRGVNPQLINQDPPVEFDLLLTLEELYLGCIKKIKITRKVLNDDGITTTPVDKILTVEVQRGWKPGTKVIFPREGDQGPNRIPADMVFFVKEDKHPRFTRQQNDLVHQVDISLIKALTGSTLDILTLDGRVLKIPLNDTITPDYVKRVSGEGMPIRGPNGTDTGTRGDLIIKFRMKFPKSVNEHQKTLLKQAFGSS